MTDFDAWHAHMVRQIKWLFVLVFIVEVFTIGALIHWGMWPLIVMPITGLGVACMGRYTIYLRDHGRI